jgi:hypothetical protein
MNRSESVDLWKRCQAKKRDLIASGVLYEEAHDQARKIWNDWALALRSERKLLKEHGLWQVVRQNVQEPEGANTETKDWLSRAMVDFTAIFFRRTESDDSIYLPVKDVTIAEEVNSVGEAIDFRGYIFPGTLSFRIAVFDGWVWFQNAEFDGPTTFRGAQFRNWAGFQDTTFEQRAMLKEVTFTDYGVFQNAHFIKDALFDLSEFRLGDFCRAHFDSEVSFFAIECLRGFLVDDKTRFLIVPNFIQASFREAPNMTLTIIPNYPDNIRRPDDVQARYGALKRLAAQAQDHNADLHFFVEELRATPWRNHLVKKIASLFFGLLSNYGRSILLPIFWWIVNGFGFWLIYNGRASSAAAEGASCVWSKALSYGPATYVAVINNIPFSHFFTMPKRDDALLCIGGTLDALWPGLSLCLLLQNMIAALLLFLLLLALRNYFRIR